MSIEWMDAAADERAAPPARSPIPRVRVALAVLATGALATCTSDGPFSDIHIGTPVLVSSTVPKVLGAALLKRPFYDGSSCRFTFELDVPASGQWYEIQVGDRLLPAVPRSQVPRVQLVLG